MLIFPFLWAPELNLTGLFTTQPLVLTAGLVPMWSSSPVLPLVVHPSRFPFQATYGVSWLSPLCSPHSPPPPDTTSSCPAVPGAHYRSLGKLRWGNSSDQHKEVTLTVSSHSLHPHPWSGHPGSLLDAPEGQPKTCSLLRWGPSASFKYKNLLTKWPLIPSHGSPDTIREDP